MLYNHYPCYPITIPVIQSLSMLYNHNPRYPITIPVIKSLSMSYNHYSRYPITIPVIQSLSPLSNHYSRYPITIPVIQSQSPLSNHYPCCFTLDEIAYNCNEQYFMHQKAKYAGDHQTAMEILATSDPVAQLNIAKRVVIKNKLEWYSISQKVMTYGLRAKFEQNPDIYDFLKSTGTTELVEASQYDTFWGIGLSIRSPQISNKSMWKGKNTLGKLITEIRDTM